MKLMVCFNALLYYIYRTNLDVVALETAPISGQIEMNTSNLNKLLRSGVVNLFVTNIKCYKCICRPCVKINTVHMPTGFWTLTVHPCDCCEIQYTDIGVRKFAQKLCESCHLSPKKGNLTHLFQPNGIIPKFHMDAIDIRSYFKRNRHAGIILYQMK